jgi:hypothetical protein
MNTIFVYDSWDYFVWHVEEAEATGDWLECSEMLHSGYMAIEVDGLPRLIEGTIH